MEDSFLHNEHFSQSTQATFADDDQAPNPVQPALDTLFSEFARRHRSHSPTTPSSPRSIRRYTPNIQQQPAPKSSNIDLRALDYTAEYDPHLMCPICHVPFIDPIVLDCDHTFCTSCFSEYRHSATNSERSQCPSCRTPVRSSPRKASRLIYNMCNDIKVKCPNSNCTTCMARAYIERHVVKDCPEQTMACPDVRCEKRTKRRLYVVGQCIHTTQVECDCGEIIELGREEWLRHKDSQCPNTGIACEECKERITVRDYARKSHICRSTNRDQQCPGASFGCVDQLSHEQLEEHISSCIFARLAPHLISQSGLLETVQNELASSKLRNETLEMEVERLNSLLVNQIQPRLENLTIASHSSDATQDDHLIDHDNDIEEIPRENIPFAAAIHHRDLLLPAHVRDLTPSPDLLPPSSGYSHACTHMHNHLLSLHENLRHTVSNLEADMNSFHHALAELDARTSMQIMNETLRIKEDLAYTHAALVSNRSQVQWLLNRERMGREQAIMRERGRMGPASQGQQNQGQATMEFERQPSNLTSPGVGGPSQQQNQADTFPFPSAGAGMTRTVSGSGAGSGPSSTATSPMFAGISMAGSTSSTRRPSIRGGSQERVKL